MCCAGPLWGSWGGWGMPWVMFLVPILMLVFMFFACRFFRPRFVDWCGNRPMGDHRTEEIRRLRQEVEELRKELKKTVTRQND